MKIACTCLVATAVLLGAEGSTRAQVAVDRPAPRHAVSLPLLSLAGGGGIGVQLEQQLRDPRFSVAVAFGARRNAGGDYSSLATSVSVEARYWLKGRALWCDLPARSMVGWFLGARADVARTRTRDTIEDRGIGASLSFAETLTVGYRFAVKRRLEISPSAGLGAITEVDTTGRLPAWTRGEARMGVTVGWMF